MKNWIRVLLISELYLVVTLFATEPRILKPGDPLTVNMDMANAFRVWTK